MEKAKLSMTRVYRLAFIRPEVKVLFRGSGCLRWPKDEQMVSLEDGPMVVQNGESGHAMAREMGRLSVRRAVLKCSDGRLH